MKKDERKEYQRPELTEHENLNEVTKGINDNSNPDT